MTSAHWPRSMVQRDGWEQAAVRLQSGELALRMLAGEDPARIPMTVPRNVSLSVNMNTAKQIQVQIQDDVKQKAELYF